MTTCAIALLSGGLDSTVAAALAMRDARLTCALTFDYGQRARRQEIESARALCQLWEIEHRVVAFPWLAEWTATALIDTAKPLPRTSTADLSRNGEERARAVWVPNRNGLFIAAAGALAESIGADQIITGFNAEEAQTFPDNTAEFVWRTNAALSFSTLRKVEVRSPTLHLTKAEIARAFRDLHLPPDAFWCCYEGGEGLCGTCESCVRTMCAFQEIGAFEVIAHRFANGRS